MTPYELLRKFLDIRQYEKAAEKGSMQEAIAEAEIDRFNKDWDEYHNQLPFKDNTNHASGGPVGV